MTDYKEEGSPILLSGHDGSNTPNKRKRTGSPAAPPRSSWESKKMKIDLIVAKSQILKLEARVDHLRTIYKKKKQIISETEKNCLKEQHKRDKRALMDMQELLASVRKREQELKEDYTETVKEHKQAKTQWDKKHNELHKKIASLKDKLLEENVSSKVQLSEMKKGMDVLRQDFKSGQSEIEILKKELAKQTRRAAQCTFLRNQFKKQKFELQQLTTKLREIEYERDSYKDWQTQAKTAEKRLVNMAELEKEVVRLRATERSLRNGIADKFLLEEQVHQLSSRLAVLQPVQQELHEAKMKLASMESTLEEWQSAARARASSSELTATAASSQAHSQAAHPTETVKHICAIARRLLHVHSWQGRHEVDVHGILSHARRAAGAAPAPTPLHTDVPQRDHHRPLQKKPQSIARTVKTCKM